MRVQPSLPGRFYSSFPHHPSLEKSDPVRVENWLLGMMNIVAIRNLE